MRTHQSELEIKEFEHITSQKDQLPSLQTLLESKNIFLDVDDISKEAIVQLVKYGKNLENIIRLKNKEILRLEYLNKYLVIAQ